MPTCYLHPHHVCEYGPRLKTDMNPENLESLKAELTETATWLLGDGLHFQKGMNRIMIFDIYHVSHGLDRYFCISPKNVSWYSRIFYVLRAYILFESVYPHQHSYHRSGQWLQDDQGPVQSDLV